MNVSVSQLRGFKTILFYIGTKQTQNESVQIKERKEFNEEVKS